MLKVISFILNCVIDFAKMLFTIDIGDGLNLGLLMCIIFIFLPMIIRIVYFLRSDVVEEINANYESGKYQRQKPEYIGKHEFTGRHSKQYFERQKELRRYK